MSEIFNNSFLFLLLLLLVLCHTSAVCAEDARVPHCLLARSFSLARRHDERGLPQNPIAVTFVDI